MEDDDREADFRQPPPPPRRVSLTPFIPPALNPRRLSSRLAKPSSPVETGRKKLGGLARVSLQGRLVGAEEASSARSIGGGLSLEEAAAWELFSPIHRILIVAVAAAAAVKSEKNREIRHLRNCVELRDQILMGMQQKLDNLCEQENFTQTPQSVSDLSAAEIVDFSLLKPSLGCKSDSICTDCWLCDQHRAQFNDLSGYSHIKAGKGDEMFRSRTSISNEAEQEERRMSDLSDWASSVTSGADIQLNNLAIEQDIYNLKRECEEKDAAIKELSTFMRSKDVATSKRIEELEEIIRRKNTTITKLRKDMIVLEQKVVNLTRLRRRSFSGPSPSTEIKQLPTMTDNLLYDMDSSSSPSSSSDSDCSSKKQTNTIVKRKEVNAPLDPSVQSKESALKIIQKSAPPKTSSSTPKLSVQIPRSRPVSPLKEKSLNQTHSSASPRVKPVSASVGNKSSRRRAQSESKDAASHKRWM